MLADRPVNAMIPTGDLARARSFYEEVVGFTPARGLSHRGGLQCAGGSCFLLHETQVSRGAHTVANWTVDDINAEVADLKARGVVFEHYDQVHDAPTDADSIDAASLGTPPGSLTPTETCWDCTNPSYSSTTQFPPQIRHNRPANAWPSADYAG